MGLKEIAIIVAITVLFSAFAIFTIEAFYPRPDYEKYCNFTADPLGYKLMPEQINCTYPSEAEADCYNKEGMPKYDLDEKGCRYVKECDYCSRDFNDAQKEFNSRVFYILAVIGALAIILGVYYKIEFIGTGFMFSGIFLLFYGTTQNFNELSRYARPIVLLLELGLILFVAYKKIVKSSKK